MKCKGYAYIYTIGCQMNSYDSEKLFVILEKVGYGKDRRSETGRHCDL